MKKNLAEFIGTFWLVLGGCGSAVLAAGIPNVGIGYVGVSLAFGLTVVAIAYAFGHISGAHLNPAVTIGAWVAGRIDTKDVAGYIVSQILGGIAGAGVLYLIATGNGSDIGIWRPVASWLQHDCSDHYRICDDLYFPVGYFGFNRRKSTERFCRTYHRFNIDTYSPY